MTRYAVPVRPAIVSGRLTSGRLASDWLRPALGMLLLAALVGGCGLVRVEVDPTTPTPARSGTRAGPTRAEAERVLARVRVVPVRSRAPGYDRDCGPGDGCVFGTDWSDDTSATAGHNGCDTRNDVLGTALDDVRFEAGTRGCDVVAGLLRDPYTGDAIDYATHGSQIHVDHLVPLAAAWDLGAASWPAGRRAAFANDTARELVAVSERANLAKGDSTPAEWLPPDRAAHCAYVAGYLEVVDHYDLAITAADAETIGGVLETAC